MDRRHFLLTSLAGALAAPLAAGAQAGKVPRVGFLANVRSPGTAGFQKGLQDLGYVEGQNIIVEWKFAEGKLERLPELAAELVRLKVDVIVAPADPYVEAARSATTTIPIVFALVTDPIGRGFVESLAKPGGNITGLSNVSRELAAKRLELLREMVSGASQIGVLGNPATRALTWPDTEAAARSLGVQLSLHEARNVGDLEGAFTTMRRDGVVAVIELPDAMFYAERRRIADLALKHRLPTISAFREFAEAGGPMAHGADNGDLLRRSVTYVDKIVKGAKPANLPVEQPTKFELVINLKTAKALGLTIPQSLLLRADQVIE
jgi:putative tryptophan/tyrosine transport system substrate-binding protein